MLESYMSRLERTSEAAAPRANKGRKKVIFEPGDWVWVHMRKERFPTQWNQSFPPRGDGPLQVISRHGDNAYKLDLLGNPDISATFNVVVLSVFDVGDNASDSRSNPFQVGGNDQPNQ